MRGQQPLLLLVLLSVVHGLFYAALTPPWQAPDEIAHFEYAHLLARHGRPLTPADASPTLEREIIASLYAHHAWDYVPGPDPTVVPERLAAAPFFGRSRTLQRFSLAYISYALAVWPFLGQSVTLQLYVMRLVSVLMGALVVGLTFQAARRVEPDNQPLAYGAALFVLWLPQHAYISAVVNDGSLAALLASAAVYLLLTMRLDGPTWPRALGTALAVTGALLSKATAYFLVPLAIIAALDLLLGWYRTARPRLRARPLLLSALVLGAVLLPAVPLLLLPALSAQPAHMLATVLNNAFAPGGFVAYALALAADGRLLSALFRSFTSFWVTFGWVAAALSIHWYVGLFFACALAALGWLRPARTRAIASGASRGYALLALAAALALVGLWGWFLLSSVGVNAFQGRYLFGAIVPLALLLVRGWLWWVPARRHAAALVVMVAGFIVLDAVAVLQVLLPFFYG